MTEELFIFEIARYLKEQLYVKLDKLDGSDICLLYEPKNLIIAPTNIKLTNILVTWIKNAGLVETFWDLVKYETINNLKRGLVHILNYQYHSVAVKVKEIKVLKATFIPIDALEEYDIQPIDGESIWINGNWRNELGVNDRTEYGEVTFTDIDGISLKIGDQLIPLSGIDHHVKESYRQMYFWDMLRDVYVNRKKSVNVYREQCLNFKSDLKTRDFALLMSKLRYNLYIRKDDIEIPENYHQYFEEVYNIEEFIDNSNQILFTGTHLEEQLEKKQTMLGIYNPEKLGTDYNLHAWVNVETAEIQKKTKASGVEEVNIKTVYALKPQYSYYFCSSYFEDLFLEILQELEIDTLHDVELSLSDNPGTPFIEVDNFVRKNDGTIVFIENKTTLSRYNIDETLGKISKFHKVMSDNYPSVCVEYMLIAPYKNDTVEEAYSFFTNADSCSPTDFYLPLSRFNGIKLHCVIEPEYEKLRDIMAAQLK